MTTRQKLWIAIIIILIANIWMWTSNKALIEEMDSGEQAKEEQAQ